MPDGVLFHRRRRIVLANASAVAMFGAKSLDELANVDILQMVHPDYHEKVAAMMKDLAIGDKVAVFDHRMLRLDGTEFWVDVRVSAVTIEDERGAIIVIRDATERRRADEELRKAQAQLRDAIESMPNGFALWDAEDRLVVRNSEFSNQYGEFGIAVPVGVPYAEMSRAFLDRILKTAPDMLEATIARRLAEHRSGYGQREVRLTGNRFFRTVERPTSDGGIVTIRTDITDFRRAEQALRESEKRHRLLFDLAPYGIVVVQEGKIVLANLAAARMRGFADLKAFIGASPLVNIHPDDVHEVSGRAATVLAGEVGASIPVRYRVLAPDGAVTHVDSAATKFEFRGMPALLVHQNDVTAQVRAANEKLILETQLRQVEKLKSLGTLAEGVAHEFNNLLVPIIGLTELAIDGLPPDDPNAGMLKEVVAAAQRSRELIKRIHAFGRSERSRNGGEAASVQDVVSATLDLVRPMMPPLIRLTYTPDCSAGQVKLGEEQIEQILLNLCSNAADAIGHRAGEIAIRVYPATLEETRAAALHVLMPGAYVVLSVRDTGAGMDAATMERIFDPFFTTKQVGQGTGLGLSVIHGIVSGRGGGITVSSESGKGAEFCVYLPVAETAAAAPPAAAKTMG